MACVFRRGADYPDKTMQILMCPPRFYGIEYEINPWMDRRCQSDPRLAQEQWDSLYQLLRNGCIWMSY